MSATLTEADDLEPEPGADPAEPQTEEAASHDAWQERLASLKEPMIAAGGIVAAGVYGICYLGTAEFYARFGLTPEAVGIDEATLLSRAITSAVFHGGILLLMLAMTSSPWVWWFERQKASRLGMFAAGIVTSLGASWVAMHSLGMSTIYRLIAALWIVAMSIAIAAVIRMATGSPPNGPLWRRALRAKSVLDRSRPVRLMATALIVLVPMVGFLIELRMAVDDVADDIIASGTTDDHDGFKGFVFDTLAIDAIPTDDCRTVIAMNDGVAWAVSNTEGSISVAAMDVDDIDGLSPEADLSACWGQPEGD